MSNLMDAMVKLAGRVRHLETAETGLGASAGAVACDVTLHTTNAYQDVSGCTKTLTIPTGGQVLLVIGIFDFAIETDSDTLSGICIADGSAVGGAALFSGPAFARGTVAQAWVVTLAAGSKIIKLQARQINRAAATDYCSATHTRMLWLRLTNMPFTDES